MAPVKLWHVVRPRVLVLVVGAVAAVAMVLPAAALGADPLYVDRESVGGACSDLRSVEQVTAATPWCSLGRAVTAAPSGSTVLVRRGSYPQLSVSGSRSRTAMLTLRAHPGETVGVAGALVEETTWLRLEGFRFSNRVRIAGPSRNVQLVGSDVTLPGTGIGVEIRGSDDFGDAEQILVEGNTIHDIVEQFGDGVSGYGIRAVADVDDITIRGNRLTRIEVDAIQTSGIENLRIENNEISHVQRRPGSTAHSDPIQVLNPAGTSTVISGNYIHDNSQAVLIHDGQRGLVLENNVVVGTGNFAVKIGDAPNARIVNNTIWGNEYGGLVLTEESANPMSFSGVTLANNILDSLSASSIGFAVEDYNVIASGSRRGAHDTASAPSFEGVWELAGGSVGIDAAAAAYAPAVDRLGRGRVDDPGRSNSGAGTPVYVDLGAHERGGTAGSTPPPPPPAPPPPPPDPEPNPDPAPDPVLPPVGVLFGASPERDNPVTLDGSVVSGSLYVFTTTAGVDDVRFYVDDPDRSAPAYRTEVNPPFDLAGGGAGDLALPFDTNQLGDGDHTVTVAALRTDGTTSVVTAKFTVRNSAPQPPPPVEEPPPPVEEPPPPVEEPLPRGKGKTKPKRDSQLSSLQDTTAPAVTAFSLRRTVAPRRAGRPVLTFALSEAATVRVRVMRRVGRRWMRVRRTIRFPAAAGSQSLRLAGRSQLRHRLRPGSYRITLTATDAAGNVSTPKRARFRVHRRN